MDKKECTKCRNIKELFEFYSYEKESKTKGKYIYYYPYCIECSIEKSTKQHQENRNYRNKKNKEWRENNKEHVLTYAKNYRSEHLEFYKLETKKWRLKNKDKIKEYNIYRIMNKKHEISNQEWEDCKKYFNHRCAYCDLAIENHWINYKGKLINSDFHKEHVDDQGENDISNCVPACKSCNSSKHDSNIYNWYNEGNKNFTYERLTKIHSWLASDYKKYIKEKE